MCNPRVLYAVLQLAEGGELFDFLSTTGKFSEQVSRFYFRQLIEALDHCHSHGYAHRDIKPENLFFDDKFNLLLGDFGFSTLMAGKDGSGKLKTILGTDNYMAPEIHAKAPYIGSSVDLFAAGIILFIFFTGHPPFNHAKASDPYYSLICMNNHEKFWAYHSRKKQGGIKFFSPEFINLINAMLAFDPTQRPSIAEIKAHAWYKGEVPTSDQIVEEFTGRKAQVDEAVLAKKREIQEKQARMAASRATAGQGANVGFSGVQPRYRDILIKHEGIDDVLLEDGQKAMEQMKSIKLERSAPLYQDFGTKAMTNYYSALNPTELLKSAVIIAHLACKNVELHTDKYKVTAKIPGKDDTVTVDMKIFAGADGCSVLEFCKREGSVFEYQKVIEKIKKQLDLVEGGKPEGELKAL